MLCFLAIPLFAFPAILLLAWVLAISVLMLRRQEVAPAVA